MPVLPASSDLDSLGGVKEDFEEPDDNETQVKATEFNETVANVAAMTRVLQRGYFAFSYVSAAIVLDDHDSVWGNDASVAPSIVRNGTGDYTVTLPASIMDELNSALDVDEQETQTINFKFGKAACEETSFTANVKRVTANTFTVKTTNHGGGIPMLADPSEPVWVEYFCTGSSA